MPLLMNAQWRGGSTVTEQLLFTTSMERLFILDEPAFAVSAVMRASALSHLRILPEEMRPTIAAANADALDCDFARYNKSALAQWQRSRGQLSGLPALQQASSSFKKLVHLCRKQRPELRALKTIRMIGSLDAFASSCRSRAQQCRTVQLLRHPLSIVRSRLASISPSSVHRRETDAKPDARSKGRSSISTASESSAALEIPEALRTRPDLSVSAICELMLRDVRAASEMQRRGEPILQLRYSDVLEDPEATARTAHAFLRLRTNESVLGDFVGRHFLSRRPHHRAGRSGAIEYSTVRAKQQCKRVVRAEGGPACEELLKLAPLFDC